MKIRVILLVVLLLSVWGCAATQQVVSKEDIEQEQYKRGYEEGVEKGYQKAITACQAEYRDRLLDQAKKYQEQLLYLGLVKGGIIEPARVSMEYIPERFSGDGQSYSPPAIRWRISSPPRFTILANKWFLRERENYCYFHIKDFVSQSEAAQFLDSLKKPENHIVFTDMVKHASQNKWAVIGKSPWQECKPVIDFYKQQGFEVIEIPQQ